MKIFVVIILVILGLYWLFAHVTPIPISHEDFGLWNHYAHKKLGVLLLFSAGLIWWKWKK